ncbi:hypothetical protein BO86DRAFT_440677 [Aspergillus japonicus CBS 114.51]|uniref:Methyltransferase domain-containing protein n=1 Tax=Aspergillus japonicus CBS 114.51 TaxID=1448312 RepID=A0A8T8WPJ4_ASPJA|nr:hypothetical protein BO86DRAFT_440677 [Aspergillus japonicus CBS 114.51]RAH77593.1 hypothetical protein BO86DRAFT_440677 [Aspergillus japonicus CBS 114.51]
MTAPSHISNYNQSTYWIAHAHNFRSSARLHLQHFLYQNTLGYLLEPAIAKAVTAAAQQQQQPLKIADLACGNGVWLTELHTQLTTNHGLSVQLDGFDINPVNFPAAAYLPGGVSLQQLDILATPLPAHLLGAYDVVHIRAFASLIGPDSNLTPLLTVASSLLKPGGYLQWEENRGDLFLVEAPTPDIPKAACSQASQVLQGGLRAKGISNAWVDALDAPLTQFGFQEARLRPHDKRPQDYKAWTENYLIVWEELAALFPPKAEAPNAPLSREAWVALFTAAVKETEQGVVVHQGRVVTAVGRKPLA